MDVHMSERQQRINEIDRLYKKNNPYSQLRAVEAALDNAIDERDHEVVNVIKKAIAPIIAKLERARLMKLCTLTF